MTDPAPADRLLRKRNRSLQKQLDLRLQILGEEYRQSKERMYKEERDCGKFLQSLYNTVPDLQYYGQPNTRAMNVSAILKERLSSATLENGGDDLSSETSQSSSTAAAETRPQNGREKTRGSRSSVSEGTGKGSEVNGGQVSGLPGTRNQVRKGSSIRPKTAVIHRPHHGGDNTRNNRPATSFVKRKSLGSSFGKEAYSEQERSLNTMVLKKFQVIFHPDTKPSKVKVSTNSTPIMMPEKEVCGDVSGNVNHSVVNGTDSEVDRKRHTRRRVVWSALPHRRQGTVSAPDIALLDRPSSETLTVSERPKSCRHRSSSMTVLNSMPKSETSCVRQCSSYNPLTIDPKVQALALQRYPFSFDHNHQHFSETPEHTTSDGQSSKKDLHNSHQNTSPFDVQSQDEQSGSTRKSSVLQNRLDHSSSVHVPSHAQTAENPHLHSNRTSAVTVPADRTVRKHSALSAFSRRLSFANEVTPCPEQVVARLMNAGSRPGSDVRQRKSTPSKSELSHRFIPVSRQTVVGILAHIENQKASTRNMLNTSKDLQQVVKKLVPWVQPEDSDSDDW